MNWITVLVVNSLAGAVIQAGMNVTDEDIRAAGQAYADCLVYQAIRADDRQSSPEILVFASASHCRIENAMWRVFMRVSEEQRANSANNEEQEIAQNVVEHRLQQSAIQTVRRILSHYRLQPEDE